MDGLKQRIIGALVLISLAVIFVPMVFDEPHSERTSTNIKIPEEPPFPEVNAPDSDRSPVPDYQNQSPVADASMDESSDDQPDYRLVEETANTEDASPEVSKVVVPEPSQSPAQTPPASKPPKEKTTNESESVEYAASLKGAWVVQLGSFGNADNAKGLRNDVRDKGYGSSLQEVVRGDTKLTRVFSGPFASKSDAEDAKKTLDKAFGLNSLVTKGDK